MGQYNALAALDHAGRERSQQQLEFGRVEGLGVAGQVRVQAISAFAGGPARVCIYAPGFRFERPPWWARCSFFLLRAVKTA
ncbi:hypothetical protein AZ34_14230 [Hylemonella gracilis str. Niagara R]|uniref:Uncharacterized protein n=1 Tax=Hylemonella gracilis str. Niagara R TaxID=1458275 RepID=A0A016XM77_9BURK|nr:hypothetical protein AZ34_14230 [Hylemonella gracilis str. Niagara R]